MLRQIFRRKKEVNDIDPLIDELISRMNTIDPETDQYKVLMSHLKELKSLKARERRQLVSPDTIAICICNLVGILIVVGYENKHVITGKGFTQILPLRRPNKD